MSTRQSDTAVTIASIIALALVEVVALLAGHNGTLLRLVIVAIAGLGGFSLARLIYPGRKVNHLDAGDFLNRKP
jgi:hypothetical protein